MVNDGAASWFDFAREIIVRAGIDATVTPCTSEEYSTRAARPRYSVLDNSKTSRDFGPLPPWQAALMVTCVPKVISTETNGTRHGDQRAT